MHGFMSTSLVDMRNVDMMRFDGYKFVDVSALSDGSLTEKSHEQAELPDLPVVIRRLSNTKVSESMRVEDPDPVVGAQMQQDDRTLPYRALQLGSRRVRQSRRWLRKSRRQV
jgi:hypothetical protein